LPRHPPLSGGCVEDGGESPLDNPLRIALSQSAGCCGEAALPQPPIPAGMERYLVRLQRLAGNAAVLSVLDERDRSTTDGKAGSDTEGQQLDGQGQETETQQPATVGRPE